MMSNSIIRVIRHRRGIVEFWIPEGLEGSTLQLVRWPIQDETTMEYNEVLAARQEQFAGMFTIIGDGGMAAIERLLERLETGWLPKRDEIDRDIKQVDLRAWVMLDGRPRNYLTGFDQDDTAVASGPVIYWGPNMIWALTTDGFYWLESP
jgi:hypothetical protein